MASRKHILLEFGLFACLLFFCCIKAELQMEKTRSPIRAELGQNVTLPCLLTDDHNLNLNLTIVGIRWDKTKNGNVMNVYRFINLQHNVTRNGSSIDEREIRRGNFSLTLQHVRRSDEGEYSCIVFITPNKYEANFALQVFAQPDVTLSTTELTVVLGSEETITCYVSKYYPEAVKIRWLKHSKRFSNTASLDKDTYFTVPEENSDGTFSVASLLTVKPSSLEENGDLYSCNVEHATYSHDRYVTFTLKVKEPPLSIGHIALIIIPVTVLLMAVLLGLLVLLVYFKPAPPKISDIAGLDDLAHGKSTTLSCMVSGFKPREITILFFVKRDDGIMEIGSWVYPAQKPKPKSQHDDTVDASRTLGETAINMKSNKPSSQMESESQPQHEDTVDSSRSPEEMALNPIPNKRSSQTKPESKLQHEDTVYSSKDQEELITMIHKIYPFLVKLKPLKLVKSYFSYSCFCFADILPDIEKHKGAKLIIAVTHRALKSPLIVERALQITGDFLRLSAISAPQSMKHGEEVTLTCEIFTGSKQPLHITWLKKYMMNEKPTVIVYEKGKEISDKYKYKEEAEPRGYVFCTSSSITFTLNITEDHETNYICQVSNPATSQILQSCLDTFVTGVDAINH